MNYFPFFSMTDEGYDYLAICTFPAVCVEFIFSGFVHENGQCSYFYELRRSELCLLEPSQIFGFVAKGLNLRK